MADNVAKLARYFAIAQLIVGFLLFCFGIGEKYVEKLVSQRMYIGIGAGIWVSRTGVFSVKCYILYSITCVRVEVMNKRYFSSI